MASYSTASAKSGVDCLQPEKSLLANGLSQPRWRKAACIKNGKCLSRCITAVSVCLNIILIAVVALQKHYSTSPAHCDPQCPRDWITYQRKCYYFSDKEQNWNASQIFCSSHGAFLARIENEDKDFVMRNKGKDACWIGIRKEPGQAWKWLDGENATLEVLGDGGNCAYLNDEAKASSSRCSTEHHWICIKLMKRKVPKEHIGT